MFATFPKIYPPGQRFKEQGGLRFEGESNDRITVQRQTGVPAQDLGDGGMVGSGSLKN
jgi:hypothetical protein